MKTKSNLIKLCLPGLVLLQAAISDAQPVITQQPTNQMAVSGGNAAFSVMVTGVGPFTYQWQFNGTNLANNIITTVAGNGSATYAGDNGAATNASLFKPAGVAFDVSGNLYIADYGNNRIRMLGTNGIITTVVGTGTNGSFGNGGAATNTRISSPNGVALDSSGNLYFPDYAESYIRMVNTNGIISVVAGTGVQTPIRDGGAATNAALAWPASIAFDSGGNWYVADMGHNRIRKVDTNGIITTVAGNGQGGHSGDGGAATNANLMLPDNVAFDAAGNLYVSDWGNNRIRKVDTNGIITTVAGNGSAVFSGDGGMATNASLAAPGGVTFDVAGNMYIADYGNNRIRKVDTNGIITTLAGNGPNSPAAGSYSGDGGAATNASLSGPACVAFDASGNLYIADLLNARIREVHFAGIPSISFTNVGINNAGNYSVVITSSYGSVTSSIVSLSVLLPPSITTQPTGTAAPIGGPANLNVAVSGTAPFAYQWSTSSGRSAVAVALINAFNQVFLVAVPDGGAGYVTVPNVQFVGGGGSGATGTAALQNGFVMSINLINHGSGYTNPPTILIDPPTSTINAALTGETNATLAWSSVASTDATNYFVVVSNDYGSVTSSIVALRPFLPPQNFTAQNLGTGLQMQFTGTPNFPYILQSATNLIPPISWQAIAISAADVNGNWQFTDTNLNVGQKFYRALGQ